MSKRLEKFGQKVLIDDLVAPKGVDLDEKEGEESTKIDFILVTEANIG